MTRKKVDATSEYTYWIGDLNKANLVTLVKHCDHKIDLFFADLDKRIPRIIRAEVKRQLSKKVPKGKTC